MTTFQPLIEWDEEEIHPACVVRYPRIKDAASGQCLLNLADGSWHLLEDRIEDGTARLVVSHKRSYARFRLTMSSADSVTIDDDPDAYPPHRVQAGLARRNIDSLVVRARTLLAKRTVPAADVVEALGARRPIAKAFYPRIGRDGASETADAELYWLLYDYDAALALCVGM